MLRWRLFGISFCIQPSFFLMNALFGYILYEPFQRGANERTGLLYLILIFVLCMFVTVMVHELGHAIMGRLFGQPGSITLSGTGGQAVMGYQEISAWKRILVIAAGPGAGFLLVGVITVLDGTWWNWCVDWLVANAGGLFWDNFKCNIDLIDRINPNLRNGWAPNLTYRMVMTMLFMFSLFINIINLLPIIPMDGGMIFKEICCLVAPRGGLKFAFAWSFLLATGCTIYLLLACLERWNHRGLAWERDVNAHYTLYYPFAIPEFSLFIFGMLAYQSWQTYRQLALTDRYMAYMQEDMSEVRRPTHNVKEIPVKDPRDFAPPAPGSERPRL